MSDYKFPALTEDMLLPVKAVIKKVKAEPNSLDSSQCHYPESIKEFFRSIVYETGLMDAESIFTGEDDADFQVIDDEIKKQISYLSEMKNTIGNKTEKERMDYIKLSTNLLEKLINLREKTAHIKQVNEFRSEIMAIFEQILSPDQRTLVMERLEAYL